MGGAGRCSSRGCARRRARRGAAHDGVAGAVRAMTPARHPDAGGGSGSWHDAGVSADLLSRTPNVPYIRLASTSRRQLLADRPCLAFLGVSFQAAGLRLRWCGVIRATRRAACADSSQATFTKGLVSGASGCWLISSRPVRAVPSSSTRLP